MDGEEAASDADRTILSWPECARLCRSSSAQPHTLIAFTWGPTEHVLRRFFHTTALPNLRRLHIELPIWDRGPGELFCGLATRGRALEEMVVRTFADLSRKRVVTFTIRVGKNGEPTGEYSFPGEQTLSETELQAAASGLGIPLRRPRAT